MWPSGYWPMHYWSMHWMLGGPIMMIFVIVCIAMMFFMMRGGMIHRHRRRDAIDILKERYAQGDISQGEYEEKRRLLES